MHAKGRDLDPVRAKLKREVCPVKVDLVASHSSRAVKDFGWDSKPKPPIRTAACETAERSSLRVFLKRIDTQGPKKEINYK